MVSLGPLVVSSGSHFVSSQGPFSPSFAHLWQSLQLPLMVPFATSDMYSPVHSVCITLTFSSSAEVLWTDRHLTNFNIFFPFITQGPSKWEGLCKNGTSQSPIDINSTAATYQSMAAFNLENYASVLPLNFIGKNNGHTMAVTVPPFKYFVNGGGLLGNFTTAQFHLHWGSSDSKGSEHTIDGKQYAAEVNGIILFFLSSSKGAANHKWHILSFIWNKTLI